MITKTLSENAAIRYKDITMKILALKKELDAEFSEETDKELDALVRERDRILADETNFTGVL